MSARDVERVKFTVPVDTGHLIGNTLRQFAMRGAHTWQVAAYKVGAKEGSFGFSGGASFSCLDLFDGTLVCSDAGTPGSERLCRFELSGDRYVANGTSGPMYIENLGKLGVMSMQVCLVYASGSRTAEQNYEVAKRIFGKDDEDFYSVPSRHTAAITFRYEVTPRDFNTEELCITATTGAVSTAPDSARMVLRDLQPAS